MRMHPETDPNVHLVSTFDTRDFGAATMRIGDLNGDGAPDLLFAQSIFGQRTITCLTATTIFGDVLWQTGTPCAANDRVYSDLPVQIYDWDNDGRNEVLFVRQARYVDPILHHDTAYYRDNQICERARRYEGSAIMVVLDGLTGREKCTFPLPPQADDSFLLADLTGRGRREDLVVKDRYWNMWGVSHEGDVLWHWRGSTGHYPALADIDDDGRDEVFVGCALIDHDGRELFRKDGEGWFDGVEDAWGVPAHQDAALTVRLDDGSWRLIFGNHGVHCLDAVGNELWRHRLVFEEAQHVVAGRFRADSACQVAVIDRGAPRSPDRYHEYGEREPACLYLFDLATGEELWRRPQLPGGWCAACMDIRWTGAHALPEILVYGRGTDVPTAVYDGHGEIVAEIDQPVDGYCRRADVWGDSRDEIILGGRRRISVYTNGRAASVPTLYNNTLYHGM